MNLTKPYFKSTRSPHQRDDLSTFDVYKPAYLNPVCIRNTCSNAKKIATETTLCDACLSLDDCEYCGDIAIDCGCDDPDFLEECGGCEEGCGICAPSRRVNGHFFDRERWGYDG